MKKSMSEIIKERYKNGWSPRKGKKHSKETIERIRQKKLEQKIIPKSAFKKGVISWNKGLKFSNSYGAIHKRIGKLLGKPDECSICGVSGLKPKQINWANIGHTYNEENYHEWVRMCCKCHRRFDYGKL